MQNSFICYVLRSKRTVRERRNSVIQVILLLSYMLAFQAGNETERIVDTNDLQAILVEEQSENVAFKDLAVSGKSGIYTVTGQTNVKKGEFFYTVEDGHNEYIPETLVKVSAGELTWTSFNLAISIPAEKLAKKGTLILNVYEKSESGQILDSLPVVLETFKDKQS